MGGPDFLEARLAPVKYGQELLIVLCADIVIEKMLRLKGSMNHAVPFDDFRASQRQLLVKTVDRRPDKSGWATADDGFTRLENLRTYSDPAYP